MSGSSDVVVDDGRARERLHFDRPRPGPLPDAHDRRVDNFSASSVCLVLASAPYDEDDYLRDYGEFLAAATGP